MWLDSFRHVFFPAEHDGKRVEEMLNKKLAIREKLESELAKYIDSEIPE